MKLSIFYAKTLPNPLTTGAAQIAYYIAWLGALAQLGIEPASDEKLLENVFEVFNIGRPAGAENLRSMSPGDVVVIEDRAYECLMAGWKLLDDFQPELEKLSFSSLAGFESLIRPGAKVYTINHHTFTGARKEGELIFGDVSRGVCTVGKIEASKFWLHDPKCGDDDFFDQWSDIAEFENYRIEDNKLTVLKKVGAPGWEKVGDLANGDDFDWMTFWLVE